MKVTMAHGSGGSATGELIAEVFAHAFDNPVLNRMEDSAVVEGFHKIAVTTDSFVVRPLEYPGGDIGRLSVCGTVNDLLMRGSTPKYLTCGFILEEGADVEQLKRIVASMAETAKEAGVIIVAGDTKVVEGNGGIMINTTGVGFAMTEDISSSSLQEGDAILVSGTMGDHHAAILSSRLGIENNILSDTAPLCDMVSSLLEGGIEVHTMRDVTRGGLGTVLKELAEASACELHIKEQDVPVNREVRDFCGLLGLDPYYMGNEGKMLCAVAGKDAKKALEILKHSKYGEGAAQIGVVTKGTPGEVISETAIGGKRSIGVLQGEGLPRIC